MNKNDEKEKEVKKNPEYEDGDSDYSEDDTIDDETLQHILEELAGGDESVDKIMKKEMSKQLRGRGLITNKVVSNRFLDYLIQLVITMALICGICGWFSVFDGSFYKIIIYAFAFATIDYWLKTIVYEFRPLLVLKSFGTITLLLTIIIMVGLVLPLYFFWNLALGKTWVIIGCSCLFLIIRTFIITYLKRRKI